MSKSAGSKVTVSITIESHSVDDGKMTVKVPVALGSQVVELSKVVSLGVSAVVVITSESQPRIFENSCCEVPTIAGSHVAALR